jgi:hypothetical protein
MREERRPLCFERGGEMWCWVPVEDEMQVVIDESGTRVVDAIPPYWPMPPEPAPTLTYWQDNRPVDRATVVMSRSLTPATMRAELDDLGRRIGHAKRRHGL